VDLVRLAEPAVLPVLDPVRMLALVLGRRVIPPLAVITRKSDLVTHIYSPVCSGTLLENVTGLQEQTGDLLNLLIPFF
jgi:hypothetical protein